jgi:hypothetical protein
MENNIGVMVQKKIREPDDSHLVDKFSYET